MWYNFQSRRIRACAIRIVEVGVLLAVSNSKARDQSAATITAATRRH